MLSKRLRCRVLAHATPGIYCMQAMSMSKWSHSIGIACMRVSIAHSSCICALIYVKHVADGLDQLHGNHHPLHTSASPARCTTGGLASVLARPASKVMANTPRTSSSSCVASSMFGWCGATPQRRFYGAQLCARLSEWTSLSSLDKPNVGTTRCALQALCRHRDIAALWRASGGLAKAAPSSRKGQLG